MKRLALFLIVCGAVGLAFAYWGLETSMGRAHFDEMDGLYPFFGGVAGIVLILAGLVTLLVERIRR